MIWLHMQIKFTTYSKMELDLEWNSILVRICGGHLALQREVPFKKNSEREYIGNKMGSTSKALDL